MLHAHMLPKELAVSGGTVSKLSITGVFAPIVQSSYSGKAIARMYY